MIRSLSCTEVEACVCLITLAHTGCRALCLKNHLFLTTLSPFKRLRPTLSTFSPSCAQYQSTMKTQHSKGFPKTQPYINSGCACTLEEMKTQPHGQSWWKQNWNGKAIEWRAKSWWRSAILPTLALLALEPGFSKLFKVHSERLQRVRANTHIPPRRGCSSEPRGRRHAEERAQL